MVSKNKIMEFSIKGHPSSAFNWKTNKKPTWSKDALNQLKSVKSTWCFIFMRPPSSLLVSPLWQSLGWAGWLQGVLMRKNQICFKIHLRQNIVFKDLIWLIFTRMNTPSEICRWFPKIVFTLLPCVRPINVGFSKCFFLFIR